MNNITICIPIYKRLLMLEELVLSIIGCNFDKSLIKEVHIIIVDNDIEQTVENTINEIKERFHGYIKWNIFVILLRVSQMLEMTL